MSSQPPAQSKSSLSTLSVHVEWELPPRMETPSSLRASSQCLTSLCTKKLLYLSRTSLAPTRVHCILAFHCAPLIKLSLPSLYPPVRWLETVPRSSSLCRLFFSLNKLIFHSLFSYIMFSYPLTISVASAGHTPVHQCLPCTGEPETGDSVQMWSHKCRIEGKNHCP